MFSYRHAFHAGSHADVLKHVVWLAVLDHLMQKDKGLLLLDTHAGAGQYALTGQAATTSGEAQGGIAALWASDPATTPAPVQRYLALLRAFNEHDGKLLRYPGSPAISAHLMRQQDQLRVFEVHPTDQRHLRNWAQNHSKAKQIHMQQGDGFVGTRALLPPPTRRGALLCDPSYELKSDYAQLAAWLQDGLQRFATGVFVLWLPQIARLEAQELPRRLRTIAQKAQKPWLHALLQVRGSSHSAPGGGLSGSSVFIVNPTFALHAQMRAVLPYLVNVLGQDKQARSVVSGSFDGQVAAGE